MQDFYYVKSKTKNIIGLSLLTLILLQLLIPSPAYLATNKTILNTHSINSIVKPLQQSSNIRLLGPNNENQPVVNEGNNIKLKVTDVNGNAINDSSVTFTTDSPDVVTVDSQGNIQGKLFGFATVTAKRGSESAQIFVVVARVQQAVGMMLTGQMEKDSGGGLYLSDPARNIVIKKAGAFAAPTTFAGTGTAGSGGDEGDATSAQLNGPVGVAVDNGAFGGVYIADSLNHKIRKIEGKKIKTVLGAGNIGIPSGLMNSDEISFNTPQDVGLNFPQGVAVDIGGQVFVADSDNATIYLVDFGRKRVKLFAGQPGRKGSLDGKGRQAMFTRPIALNLNSTTRVLNVLDQDSSNKMTVVRQIAPDGTVKTIKKKRATFADEIETLAPDDIIFNNGRAISSDGTGNVYVVDDTGANLITFPVNQDPQLVSLAQPGQGITFNQATSITVQGTQSFVVDSKTVSTNQAVKIVSVGPPKIATLSKDVSRIDQPGEQITIIGSNFAPETQLILGDSLVKDFTVLSAREISFRVPTQKFSGTRTLSVITRGGVDQKPFAINGKSLTEINNGEITTFAGGIPYLGDGALATDKNVAFSFCGGVILDSLGNVISTDVFNNRVRKVDAATGIITTIAGTGAKGVSGDGGLAALAELDEPQGLAIDSEGNIFIATANNRVRKIDAKTGNISTIIANNQLDTSVNAGDLLHAATDKLGNLFVSDIGNNQVRKIDRATGRVTVIAGNGRAGFSGDGGLAVNASLNRPNGLAVDGEDNIFIVDENNNRVRRVDIKTGVINTFAGNGEPRFSGDGGLAINASLKQSIKLTLDNENNLLISDFGNGKVRKVDVKTGVITSIFAEGNIVNVQDVTVDQQNNFILANFNQLLKAKPEGTKIAQFVDFAGNPLERVNVGDKDLATKATLNVPVGIATDKTGNVFIVENFNNRIRRVDALTNVITTVAGNGFGSSGDNKPATQLGISPSSVALDKMGNIYIAEFVNKIRKVDILTSTLSTIAGSNDSRAGFSGDGSPAINALLNTPIGVALDTSGNVIFCDTNNQRIRKIDANTGIITTIAGNGQRGFSGDETSSTNALLNTPQGIALDEKGNIFIADTGNSRIRKIDANTGIITTIAGNGQRGAGGDNGLAVKASLDLPLAVTIDKLGHIFIADTGNSRIRKIDANTGIITTIAGNGNAKLDGDGGLAINASLQIPTGIAIDGLGNLFVTDENNSRVRVVKGIASSSLGSANLMLSVSPSVQTVTVGQRATFNISLVRNNVPDSVALSVLCNENCPTGISVDRAMINTLQNNEIINFSTSNGVPAVPGNYQFFVQAKVNGVPVANSNLFTLNLEAPLRPSITAVTFSKPNLIIRGVGFASNSFTNIKINGNDASGFIIEQTASQITLKGKSKKLSLKHGANTIVVTSNGITSNTFTFNFLLMGLKNSY